MSNNSGQSFWSSIPDFVKAIAALLTAIASCVGLLYSPLVNSQSQTPTAQVSATQPLAAQPSANKTVCPYEGATDEITITNLINAEAEALNREDISIISTIYSSDAFIRFVFSDGSYWDTYDPIKKYKEDFSGVDFKNLKHSFIQPDGEGITNDTARFISDSSGTVTGSDGVPIQYQNEVGSDSWVLKKNSAGCWIIVEHIYQ